MKVWKLGLAAAAIFASGALAQTPNAAGDKRGELLYATHCVGCHTTEVHWREKKLATDWAGLTAQVERWQQNNNLGWSADDIAAVARHLNAAFYHYPMPAGKSIGVRGGADRIAQRD